MGLDAKHPQFIKRADDWTTMSDLYEGERKVKEEGIKYLPPTAGMVIDGMSPGQAGHETYKSYRTRAVFPDFVREGVEALIGLMHQKKPSIMLPPAMEFMRENATITGESLEMLLRRINEQQLGPGRLGLLADLPQNPDPQNPMPYIALYVAEAIHNWDDGSFTDGFNTLNMVVLNESGYKREDDFLWKFSEKYRLLQLGELDVNEPDGTVVYTQGLFDSKEYNTSTMQTPMIRGVPLTKLPFVFINSKDIVAEPDVPPLMGLGYLTLAIYRGEADYRQNLYMQGQDTFVTIGGVRNPDGIPGEDDAIRTGAGSRVDCEMGGDAKYVGVSSTGLAEQRSALENDRRQAASKAGQLIQSGNNKQESGEALRIRLAAQTASLNQIALAGAAGLEHILRTIAEWMGLDPAEVSITANVEFADMALNGQEVVQLMTARTMGAPLSFQSIHEILVDRGLTTMDYEAEMQLIAEEDANSGLGLGTGAGGNPAAPGATIPPGDPALSGNPANAPAAPGAQ